MKLAYWNLKGRGELIRILLHYFGFEYTEFNPTSHDEAHADFAKHHFNFPNLPYLIDGDINITESSAIPLYIAYKAKRTDFFGKDDIEKVYHQEIIGVLTDISDGLLQTFFKDNYKDFFESKQKPLFLRKFGELSKVIGAKDYFFNQITFADFKFYAQLYIYKKIAEKLGLEDVSKTFPNLTVHLNRVSSLPGVKEYLALESTKKRPNLPKTMVKLHIDL